MQLNKYKKYLPVFLLPLLLSGLTSCDSNGGNYFIDSYWEIQADTAIYLSSLPANVNLKLGKSVLIKNGSTVFRFAEVLEYSNSNSAILLEVESGFNSYKVIELNTHNIPASYLLENGYPHKISLKKLYSLNDQYRIVFTYNQFGYAKNSAPDDTSRGGTKGLLAAKSFNRF